MWDDYHALRRAIRRPMRKWWWRIGVWWLLALLLLLLVDGCCWLALRLLSDDEFLRQAQATNPQFWNALYQHYNFAYHLRSLFYALAYLLAPLLGLLAGKVAILHATELLRDWPTPGMEKHGRALFLTATAAVWPVFLFMLLMGSGLWQRLVDLLAREILDKPLESWGYYYEGFQQESLLILPVLMGWLLFLLLATGQQRWPLAWCLAATIPVVYIQVPELMYSIVTNYRVVHALRFSELVDLGLGFGWVLGGLLIGVLGWSLRHSKRRIAVVVLSLICVSSFLFGFGDRLPFTAPGPRDHHPAVNPSSNLAIGLDLLRSAGEFTLQPLADSNTWQGNDPEPSHYLNLAFPVRVEKKLSFDANWLALALNLGYVALHYLLICWLLSNRPFGLRSAQASTANGLSSPDPSSRAAITDYPP